MDIEKIVNIIRDEAYYHIDTKRKPLLNDDMMGERIDRIIDIKIGEAFLHLADVIEGKV